MNLYVDEILSKIDKATGDEKIRLLKEYGSKPPINMIFSLNFNENNVINVPEGVPPYKRDESQHPDTYQTTLAQSLRRIGAILKGRSEHIPRLKREYLFIQILEGIPPKEAEVLVFVKDKALHELYPTITRELVEPYFPALCARKHETK